MGAVSFSLDSELVTLLQSELSLRIFCETGTFMGDSVEKLKSYFETVISIEISEELWEKATKRFDADTHVNILKGKSGDRLSEVKATLQNSGVLYWLDAHWCKGTDTPGDISECPLLEELKIIGALNSDSVILIDDARLFLSPPLRPHEISQWPQFHEIVLSLLSMSSNHKLMVVNDVIAFYPRKIEKLMQSFAQTYGVDWLDIMNFYRDNQIILQSILEKEAVIGELSDAIKNEREYFDEERVALNTKLQQKELIIDNLSRSIKAYSLSCPIFKIFRPFTAVVYNLLRRVISIFSPRLGVLNQYAPRQIIYEVKTKKKEQLDVTPTISIVTPSYQQGQYLERTIVSVVEQDYPNIEYFVQDGGSDDSSIDVLKQYDYKLSGWRSEPDTGQSQAINRAFSRTKGEIMAWLNSDDLLLPNALCKVSEFFNAHPDVDVVYGNRLLIDENDMEIGRWIMPGHNDNVLSWADYVPQETLFWRREIWNKVGGNIDESYRFAMDWELLMRFRKAGAKFAHIPNFLGAFRIHQNQKTSAEIDEVGHQEMDRIRQRELDRIPSRNEIRKAVLPFLLKHVAIDLIFRIKERVWGR